VEVVLRNAMTIDLEDWFHILDAASSPPMEKWEHLPSRVETATATLLDHLDAAGVKATFFCLGWVAQRYPRLIRAVAARGHEIASHGFAHALAHRQSAVAFREDLRRSLRALEDAVSSPVLGYRAAGFSITPLIPWAFEVLREEGLQYDASVFPGRHGHGGWPGAPSAPFCWDLGGGEVLPELPVASVRVGSRSLAFGGGGYFRLAPGALTRALIRHLNAQGTPAVTYLHPRDLDRDQPILSGLGPVRAFKCYVGVRGAEAKFVRLLGASSWGPARDLLVGAESWPHISMR
jgi:polysaccharide deacetylase family protein (PEP-CTERM system associated)